MDAKTRSDMLDSLRREEGFRGNPYRCSADRLTVGYGTLLPLTQKEADWLLRERLAHTQDRLAEALDAHGIHYMGLPAKIQRALAEMAYQMGVRGVCGFRDMLAAVRVGDWPRAHDEALDSRWARQTPGRAKRMAALLLNGTIHPRRDRRAEVST